jgi:hypothetical protein
MCIHKGRPLSTPTEEHLAAYRKLHFCTQQHDTVIIVTMIHSSHRVGFVNVILVAGAATI